MEYLKAAINLGFPADCATNGRTYNDLKRTWNPAYGDVPLRAALTVHEAGSCTPEKPKRKKFFGLF